MAERKNSALLKEVAEFVDSYLDFGKCKWLVRMLLDILILDDGIPAESRFRVTVSDSVQRHELETVDRIEIEPFLVDVIGFILNNRKVNSEGRLTFEHLFSQESTRSPWKYNNTMLRETHPIDVARCLIDSNPIVDEKESSAEVKKSSSDIINERILASGSAVAEVLGRAIDAIAAEMESGRGSESDNESSVEAEIIDEPSTDSTTSTTIIQHQNNVIQTGDNSVSVVNNGEMTINM